MSVSTVNPLYNLPNRDGFRFLGHKKTGKWILCSVKLTTVKVWSYVKSDYIQKSMHIIVDSAGQSCYDSLDGWEAISV